MLGLSSLKRFWIGAAQKSNSLPRLLRSGALVWSLFSLVQVLLNGVVPDEGVVPAQIITGAVRYPAGHPHQIYYTTAFSLLNYIGAVLWMLVPNALVLSGVRNILTLFLSVYVPYALVVLLTEQPLWGYLASALTLSETVLSFQGLYPLMIYPHFWSTGHIGLHLAILTAILVTAGLWRTGGFLLGLLPAIHLTMALVVWPWSICYLAFNRQARAHSKRLVAAVSLGLALCAGLATVIGVSHPSGNGIDSVYRESANKDLIYSEFERTSDFHRQPFPYHTVYPMWVSPMVAYMINPLAFFTMGILLLRSGNDRVTNAHGPLSGLVGSGECLGMLVLVGIAWIYLLTAWLVELSVGSLPWFFQILMPGRFSNFSAVLLIPFMVAAFAIVVEASPTTVRTLAILMASFLLMTLAAARAIRVEWLAPNVFFVMGGMLVACMACAPLLGYLYRFGAILTALIVTGILYFAAPDHHAGVKILVPFLISWGVFRVGAKVLKGAALDWHAWNVGVRISLVLACGIYSAAALRAHAGNNGRSSWEVVSGYDQEMTAWLRAHTKPDEMILAQLESATELQVKTGHPVLMELESLLLMTYMRSLAPPLNVMLSDLFGIDYTRSGQLRGIGQEMKREIDVLAAHTWEQRKCGEWQELGRRYGFRLVLSFTKVRLRLPTAVAGPEWTLYVIPPKPVDEAHASTEGFEVRPYVGD